METKIVPGDFQAIKLPKEELIPAAFFLKEKQEMLFLEIGAVLKAIRDSRVWEEEYESFDNPKKHNFIEEFGYKKDHANKLIRIYETFVERYKIPVGKLRQVRGWSFLAEILPYVKNEEDALAKVELAIYSLNEKALRDALVEEKTGITMYKCPHEETYYLEICKRCKAKTGHEKDSL